MNLHGKLVLWDFGEMCFERMQPLGSAMRSRSLVDMVELEGGTEGFVVRR